MTERRVAGSSECANGQGDRASCLTDWWQPWAFLSKHRPGHRNPRRFPTV